MFVLVKIATQIFEIANFTLTQETIEIVNSTIEIVNSTLKHDPARIVPELVNTKSQNTHPKISTQ
jgi:hypothetical protein